MRELRRISIDGPAGSGKSTVGEQLARRLGYLYIDTGAMYRAVAWLALQEGRDLENGPALEPLARHAKIIISPPHINDGRKYTITVQGNDVTWDIHSESVTRAVSPVCLHPEVRAILIPQMRAMGQQDGVVMVGRDVGTVVLPDAELKIYLTASLEVRAQRRHAEFAERLGEDNLALPSMTGVLKAIRRRDDNDRDNMRPADDAVIVMTEHLSVPQVLDIICNYREMASTRLFISSLLPFYTSSVPIECPMAIKVLFFYGHRDEELRRELEKQLSILQWQGQVSGWQSSKIGSELNWAREVREHLDAAHIILLLLVADSVAIDYSSDVDEVKLALAGYQAGGGRVIPLLLQAFSWEGIPFGRLQVLPTDDASVRSWPTSDAAFLNVALGIRKVIEQLNGRSFIGAENSCRL